MEKSEVSMSKLDKEFDQLLAEMKPPVLRLPHKSDRQKCALWIKKFCDPPASGITGRKNRNMYAQLLLHMLHRGHLEEPFTEMPEPGPLRTLPPYMSIYFDNVKSHTGKPEWEVPDWVSGELPLDRLTGASASAGQDVMSTHRAGTETDKYTSRRPYASMDIHQRDRSPSPPLTRSKESRVPPLVKDYAGGYAISDADDTSGDGFKNFSSDLNWKKGGGLTSTFTNSAITSSTFDQPSIMRNHEKEMDMRTKMLEAKFQEERLKLQQKHDATVQKILDRKNTEIEDLKTHYRNKTKEQEETVARLDKQVQSLSKELQVVQEQRDARIKELQKMAEENSQTYQTHCDKKLHDALADFEQEKFELHRKHTQNIQELLDDTNARLHKMEEEYSQQTAATSSVIVELESRIQQLTAEAETTSVARNLLEQEKAELEQQLEGLRGELRQHQARIVDFEKDLERLKVEHNQEIRALKNKHEANKELFKQEQSKASIKAADTISELEQHITQLKKSLEKSEQEKQQRIREMEQQQHHDKIHIEQLHDSKLRALQKEMDHMEQELQKKIRKAESALRDKEEEMRRLKEIHRQQLEQSQVALEEFKLQVERNSNKIYDEMKQQMERVSADLDRSKQLREKQALEFHKQVETEKIKHEREIQELKYNYEQEKTRLLQESQAEKELLNSEREQELDSVRSMLKSELSGLDTRARERQERDAKTIAELEEQVCRLREEVVQGNQLRKQQLVELGLLREEEKQKMAREHENQMTQFKSQVEQHRLDMEKKHTAEMEQVLEKTNKKLQDIEYEYSQRSETASKTINDLRTKIQELQEEIARLRETSEQQMAATRSNAEDERRKLKQQHNALMMSLQQESENQKSKVRSLERKLGQTAQEAEEKMNELRRHYEERMKGLMPATVRKELEDTISSLKSQVNSLQQRAQILQEDIDSRGKYSTLSSLTNSLASSTPIPTS